MNNPNSTEMSINVKISLFILSILIIGTTLYLTKHYYNIRFPTSLNTGSLCDINSFLNCDAATNSPLSNLFGVPISVFGVIMGLLFLSGILISSENLHGAIFYLSGINFLGCVLLFIYSLISLGSLCPFCTVYYLLSGIVFFVYFKYIKARTTSLAVMSIIGLLSLPVIGASYYTSEKEEDNQKHIAVDLIKQYDSLKKLSKPSIVPPFHISKSGPYDQSPINLIIFSDFQCPACKALSEMVHPILKRYKGKINILYYFYPLDSSCNPSMSRALHPMACKAAYLSYCLPKNFFRVHDDIFANQEKLGGSSWLDNYAKKENVTKCMTNPKTKEKVVEIIRQGNEYNIKSTPTMLLNGVKIEGALPIGQFYILLDELIRRHGQKNKS